MKQAHKRNVLPIPGLPPRVSLTCPRNSTGQHRRMWKLITSELSGVLVEVDHSMVQFCCDLWQLYVNSHAQFKADPLNDEARIATGELFENWRRAARQLTLIPANRRHK